MWVHFLLPMLSSKSNSNPQARDLILQLAERHVFLFLLSLSKRCSISSSGGNVGSFLFQNCILAKSSCYPHEWCSEKGRTRCASISSWGFDEDHLPITFCSNQGDFYHCHYALFPRYSNKLLKEIFCIWVICDATCYVQATERFEAVYPILKEVALVASPGSKAMKQITQHNAFCYQSRCRR